MHRRGLYRSTGFSFIELLVYIAISSMLFVIIISLYFALAQARLRQQSIAEVETQGLTAMNLLLQTIRNTHSINSPVLGTSAASLTLNPYATTTKPTVFDLASSTLRISESGTAPVTLTSAQVLISNLTFQNTGRPGTLGSVKIVFTVAHATSSKYGSQYSKTFYGSATVRRTPQ